MRQEHTKIGVTSRSVRLLVFLWKDQSIELFKSVDNEVWFSWHFLIVLELFVNNTVYLSMGVLLHLEITIILNPMLYISSISDLGPQASLYQHCARPSILWKFYPHLNLILWLARCILAESSRVWIVWRLLPLEPFHPAFPFTPSSYCFLPTPPLLSKWPCPTYPSLSFSTSS